MYGMDSMARKGPSAAQGRTYAPGGIRHIDALSKSCREVYLLQLEILKYNLRHFFNNSMKSHTPLLLQLSLRIPGGQGGRGCEGGREDLRWPL